MNSKGKSGCLELPFKVLISDIDEGVSSTAVGDTFFYPVLDYETLEPVGYYADASTSIISGGETVDCTFSGAYSFDYDESLENPFVSQIMTQGSCLGNRNSITGGTGAYACASGSAELVGDDEEYLSFKLEVCNICA
jgi:hypothetical protein